METKFAGRPLPNSIRSYTSPHMVFTLDVCKLRKNVYKIVNLLRGKEFDAIAFRGMSGATIAPSVALALNKSLIMVRKPKDGSHSDMRVEGDRTARTYVIIDDFQSTGETVRAIVEDVHNWSPDMLCIGAAFVASCKDMFSGLKEKVEFKPFEDLEGLGPSHIARNGKAEAPCADPPLSKNLAYYVPSPSSVGFPMYVYKTKTNIDLVEETKDVKVQEVPVVRPSKSNMALPKNKFGQPDWRAAKRSGYYQQDRA